MKQRYESPCGRAWLQVLRVSEDDAEIFGVFTMAPYRRQGLMRGVFEELLADADREGVCLLLTALRSQKGSMDTQQLADWYAQLGFDGLAVNPHGGVRMQRVPNAPTEVRP